MRALVASEACLSFKTLGAGPDAVLTERVPSYSAVASGM
jgi:hypothetical protein